jgi:uncharacterized protein with HEPN domain
MRSDRLKIYLDEMEQVSSEIITFLGDMSHEHFLQDVLTQRAVGMNLLIVGEASVRVAEEYPEFVVDHPEVPWVGIRGMRNRIAHGDLGIDLDTVWNTSKIAIPELLDRLRALRNWRAQGE